MATNQGQTEKKDTESTDKNPGNSSNKSSKNNAGQPAEKQDDNQSNGTEEQNEKEQKIPGEQDESSDKTTDTSEKTNQPQINGNSTNGNADEPGQNTPNLDTSVDNHTHVGSSQPKTETETPVRGNTVKQGQLDSKPGHKVQEEKNGGDIKSGTMKTSRFSNVFGCWRDEMIVVCLVMTIVTMVFLLFVCFHYELKIDNMNKEFRTELDNIRDKFKKQNPGNGINTCLQNDDIQNDSDTKIDTIASNVTKMNDTIKNLGDEIFTKIQNISTVLNETRSHVLENDKRLTNLNVSLDSFKTDSAQKHDRLNSSVNVLNDTIERNITEKVKSFDDHLEELQNATEKANSIISQLEIDVEKIYPNTFNKGALTAAFVIVIVFVLALYVYVFLYFPTSSTVGRTGQTINYNSVLSQIPDNCVLDNSICIVSFDEQRCPTHRRLVTPACQGKEINIFVVRSHASLLGMPRCRLYIMCAEFSERHVIIEQPNLGLGDLKRCTHDAVRKIGGELVILYTRDPGSRRLADGQMFNRDIYCVNDQPELSALRDRGRFISLYDSLTPSQNQKLTETVNECLQ